MFHRLSKLSWCWDASVFVLSVVVLALALARLFSVMWWDDVEMRCSAKRTSGPCRRTYYKFQDGEHVYFICLWLL